MGVLMALVTTLMATPMLALISPLYHRGMTAAPRPDGAKGTVAERSNDSEGTIAEQPATTAAS